MKKLFLMLSIVLIQVFSFFGMENSYQFGDHLNIGEYDSCGFDTQKIIEDCNDTLAKSKDEWSKANAFLTLSRYEIDPNIKEEYLLKATAQNKNLIAKSSANYYLGKLYSEQENFDNAIVHLGEAAEQSHNTVARDKAMNSLKEIFETGNSYRYAALGKLADAYAQHSDFIYVAKGLYKKIIDQDIDPISKLSAKKKLEALNLY